MNHLPSIRIRPLEANDAPFLWKIVYYAIFVPENAAPPPRDVVYHPRIKQYVEEWGADGDLGFVAVDEAIEAPIGAAWIRLFSRERSGYGYVADTIPELTIAVMPGYRGAGIGTRMLTRLIEAARVRYPGISLSVAPENPALRLYRRLGFEVVGRSGSSLTMLIRWEE